MNLVFNTRKKSKKIFLNFFSQNIKIGNKKIVYTNIYLFICRNILLIGSDNIEYLTIVASCINLLTAIINLIANLKKRA